MYFSSKTVAAMTTLMSIAASAPTPAASEANHVSNMAVKRVAKPDFYIPIIDGDGATSGWHGAERVKRDATPSFYAPEYGTDGEITKWNGAGQKRAPSFYAPEYGTDGEITKWNGAGQKRAPSFYAPEYGTDGEITKWNGAGQKRDAAPTGFTPMYGSDNDDDVLIWFGARHKRDAAPYQPPRFYPIHTGSGEVTSWRGA